MSHYTSYYLYQKYEKRGSQDWIPCYPNVYSVDGDGTMSAVTKTVDDSACGYIPTGDTQYRWVNMNISTDWICDECPTPTFDGKFRATYSGGTTYSAECTSSADTLTTATTRPSGYEYSAMTDAEIGQCVSSIDWGAFHWCYNLSRVMIPDSVTSIDTYAFASCYSLTSIEIPSGVTSIGDYAFEQSSGLTSINIPYGVTNIGVAAFGDCYSLTSITIPNTVTSIDYNAFIACISLTSIDIPNSVTAIGEGAFNSCRSLPSINIPSGVTSIGDRAFKFCRSLTSVTVNAVTPPTLGEEAFYDTNNCPIYVPSGSVNAYKSASGWSTYASRIQAIT